MKFKFILFFSILLSVSTVISQSKTNQLDSNGKHHGIWKKNFDNSDQLRYEGEFNHGKEIGVFKFYCSDCKSKPVIVKTFSENNNAAEVKYFTKNGKLVSEGKMIDKKNVGEWLYYHKKSKGVMMKEFYNANGKLDGKKTVYYLNNKVAEEVNYSNGNKKGNNIYYSPAGVVLKKMIYVDNELHGPATYYDASGTKVLEGSYKEGKKHGIWKIYKNGKLVKEEVFPKPRKHHKSN